jgi:cell division protein ZapE
MTPRDRYQADLGRAGFQPDPAQQQAVELLHALYEKLVNPLPKPSLWNRVFGRPGPIPGIYLWGGPGRGKTYLMDCFYESLPFADKRRIHFHRFMLEIHWALDALPRTPDPLPIVAEKLTHSCRVLCLDEFHVTDIADAMLLAGLLRALFRRGLVLVATSNTEPGALYRDGLQRERFLPAVELLCAHTLVHELAGKHDFRLELLQHSGTYQTARGDTGRRWMEKYLHEMAPAELHHKPVIRIHDRDFRPLAAAEDVVWFEFDELCRRPRSAGDYLELAREYHTVLLEGVPQFGDDLDEEARRFMHLIDALYDHGVKLIVTAAVAPEHLYRGSQLEDAFRRTASRLTEMSSRSYLARPHRPD